MTNLTRDPKGYYVALGIAEDADADAIKSAFRNKAKRLHPDFNPSPIAAKQFHRLHEAYETLSDPEARAAYDRPWKSAQKPKPSAEPKADAKPKAKAPPKAERAEPPKASPHSTTAKAAAVEEPTLCQCGKITAQPRYVVFDQVWGRLKKVQKQSVAGVFCRSCADRAAIRASLLTWIAGWWAWPMGPRETIKAIANNVRGGRKPADRNARLLLRQAKAFRARGEMELARSAGEQALGFAKATSLRGDVEQFLAPFATSVGGATRAIKDRWAKPGWAPMVQVLPLAIIVGGLSTFAVYSAPAPLTTMAREFYASLTAPARAPVEKTESVIGRVYSVAKDSASIRTGPGTNYQMEAMLKTGTLVLATETAPDGRWVRVVTADGTAGFMSVDELTPDVPLDAMNDIGAFGASTPVKN